MSLPDLCFYSIKTDLANLTENRQKLHLTFNKLLPDWCNTNKKRLITELHLGYGNRDVWM